MNIFQRRRILRNINSLDLVPIRRHHHQSEENGLITLIVPKFEKKWTRNFFISGHRRDHHKIKLDELGSETWKTIDGEKTVKEISDSIRSQHEEELDDLDNRVSQFISLLYEQRYITFQQLENARK